MKHTFFRTFLGLILGLILTFAGAAPVHAADGSLDPTFGNGGVVTTDFSGFDDLGLDLEIQPDGRIVVVGSSADGTDNDFGLARYNPDGSPDMNFGIDGKVSTDISNSFDFASAVLLQADGRIVVAGSVNDVIESDFGLARYNPDGSLDTSFDGDGKVITPVGSGQDFGTDAALQADSKIIVAGFSYDETIGGNNIVLVRYYGDGSLDATFGSSGIVTILLGCSASGYAVTVQPDGKILVAGDQCGADTRDFSLVRLNDDGSMDTTFDGDGIASTDFGNSHDAAHAIAIQPDGRIVLAGHSFIISDSSIVYALARYNPDGSPDTSFDADGKVTTDLGGWRDFGYSLAIQPDGRILVGGEEWQDGGNVDFALARYNSDGSLDTGFGADGKVITDLSTGDYGASVALQPDGKVLLAGYSHNGNNFDFTVARYVATSSPVEATLDIRPGKFPNRIELERNGCKDNDNLPVAILTTPEFDALRRVDATSLQIGDPLLGGTVAPIHSQGRDIDRDGDRDVWLLFSLCDLVSNRALDENSTELVLTGSTLDGVAFTARDSVAPFIKGSRPKRAPVFVYPVDGQILDYEGSYLFKVKPIASTEGFLWGFFQNGILVWENWRDERTLSGNEYGIHPGTVAHTKFVPGPVEVWVRASINGQWTDAAVITIHLRSTGGPLDPTFGTGGIVITDFGGNDFGTAAALQPDGKILAAGTAFNGVDEDFALARYNPDGSLDGSFGSGGKVITDFSGVFRMNINTASAQMLENLPGVGPVLAQAIVDYRTQNGPFWSIEGIRQVPGVGPGLFNRIKPLITVARDIGQAVTLQPDGRILVAGRSESQFALARYHSDGALDASFGRQGLVMTDLGGPYGIGLDIALQPDGRILVAGFGGARINFALARYNSDGTLDMTFGTNGIAITHISGEDFGRTVTLQPDGKIIVTGETFVLQKGYNFVLARYNPNGTLDTGFGSAGIVSTGFGSVSEDGISAALLQPDGRIVAVGATNAGEGAVFDFALARYNNDGSLDTTFGVDGKVTTDFGSGDAFGLAAALGADGRILVAGQNLTPDTSFNFALARYNPDGSLDTTFGNNGTLSTDIDSSDDRGEAVLIQPDGRIVVAGHSLTGVNRNFVLVRYQPGNMPVNVSIDIKPASPTNQINPKSRGRVNVAILSTPEFDALTRIDRTTLRFGRTGDEESLVACKKQSRDINHDGLRDLICVFSIPATGFQTGDVTGVLNGWTLDGIPIMGSDVVRVGRGSGTLK